ncbi:4Fe-4S binding protein [Sphaerochaeta globosa]|uniref:4Fe-4S ferredoxin-type domain-containing protein n=1 Tax=Sphaerochaeta globosa (strain ATCC BAA-1886 / DSM 22777 / Buddy) TaxID=158189 RepID=F0RZG6_SPHGB|nr:4Fe-4S binding protein [Sphaerochaeta globosa]ADY13518.1 hypothetical protein SpiBuddy_1693 [Sphaerochaeta globosa str. Buddy]
MKTLKKKHIRIRTIVQIVFFVWVVVVIALGTAAERGVVLPFTPSTASLHAICPFGGVVTAWNLITEGTLVKKIHDSSVILGVLGLLLALLFGPVICGWICPFGTFQEWVGRIGRKIFKRRYNTFVPQKIDRWLRLLRYVVLVWVLVMTSVSATLVFQAYDPYYALFSFLRSEFSLAGTIILGIVVLLSLFVERPFCKYACPYGALLGIFNRFRIFKVRRVEQTCISCSKCNRACPMNIDVQGGAAVTSAQCISCMECTSDRACPVPKTVTTGIKADKAVVSTNKVGLLTTAILVGGILLSVALGLWSTVSSKQPALIKSGDFAGYANPADIRGSYTYRDVLKSFSIPEASILAAFQRTSLDERLGDLETLWAGVIAEGAEVGTDSIRLFVSLYTGIPYEAEETTLLPKSAIEVLVREGKNTDPNFERYTRDAVTLPEGLSTQPVVVKPEAESGTLTFTGKTTLGDLLIAGYKQEEVEAILGPLKKTDSIKTVAESQGLSFSEVKTKILEL